MTLIIRALIFTSISFVMACTPRGMITVFPDAVQIGHMRSIFVGSTRGVNENGTFNSKRNSFVSFHRYNISVPQGHSIGKIDWPRGKPDPTKHFLTTSIDHFSSKAGFQSGLRKSLRNRPKGQREVVLFIHGFNNNFAEGIYRLAQLSYDMDLPNPTLHYAWPSAANPLGYGYDRDSLLFARDGLEELISAINAAGADKILLVGHSMGALLTMETLRQMAIANRSGFGQNISGVILISPDIDVDVFRRQVAKIGPLPQPFVIFTSQKDRALRLSARLSGKHWRLGNVKDVTELAKLRITLIDITKFSSSATGHFTAATSPALLKILKRLHGVDAALRDARAGRTGLLPGTILTVQQATQIILSPVAAIPR
jgi:esterase/lipase superfamily enzyme